MLKNITKNRLISREIVFKKDFGKILGLIGKKEPEAIVFKTRFGIHTFFLNFPIDVLILDKKNRVKELKEGLSPSRVMFWNLKYDIVVELPQGLIKKSETKLGDLLEFDL
jgi:hypothetical protein